jgi:ribonuclease BN (tRNA processing enzyme)
MQAAGFLAMLLTGISVPAIAAAPGAGPASGLTVDPAVSPAAGASWITLGTMGGPIAAADRGQPANLLIRGADAYLVDCGDGTVEQLAKTRIRLGQVRAVLLSHLHFDHTGGLAAVLGLRFQTNVADRLTIYGPPGTRQLVDGLIASMQPAVEAGYGLPDAPAISPADSIVVVEVGDGQTLRLGDIVVTARQNTHYSFAPGSDADRRFKSLAFRFDAPGRSIVYTGDTGPSPAVDRLAQGADLLVSEMIDVQRTIANVRRNTPGVAPVVVAGIEQHLSRHHLTPEQVGELASRANVKEVVVTHLVTSGASAGDLLSYVSRIEATFHGGVAIARDLDEF